MRLLIVIPHYFDAEPTGDSLYGSRLADPVSRIAALNGALVALHRYTGPNRKRIDGSRLDGEGSTTHLDIVILTVAGKNVLEWIGVDPRHYQTVYFDGNPMMLGFEVHRVMRERLGGYDYYGYLEDDLILDDPAFFHKLAWFQERFGTRTLLQPLRYEMSAGGTLAKVAIDKDIPVEQLSAFRRHAQAAVLRGIYADAEYEFILAENPHSGCHFVSDAQLRLWVEHPSFYDREVAWRGPIESSNTLAPGKVFDVYKASLRNPWFLGIQHSGVRFASLEATPAGAYGESPLLKYAQEGFRSEGAADGTLAGVKSVSTLASELRLLRNQLQILRTSRRELVKHLASAILRRTPPEIPSYD